MTDAFESWMESEGFDPTDLTDKQTETFEKITAERESAIEENIPIPEKETKAERAERFINTIGTKITPKQLADIAGMNHNTARRVLSELAERGEIERVKRGVYRAK